MDTRPSENLTGEDLSVNTFMALLCRETGLSKIVKDQKPDHLVESGVDRAFAISDGTRICSFVLEHTFLEPYEDRISDAYRYLRMTKLLHARLEGQLPLKARYDLGLPPGSLRFGKKEKREMARLADSISAWVLKEADRLPLAKRDNPKLSRAKTFLQPWGIQLYLLARESDLPTFKLFVALGKDLHEARKMRVRRALDKKCPKLQKANTSGNLSVLLLESDDIQMDNSLYIGVAVTEELRSRSDAPDLVVLVETDSHPYFFYILHRATENESLLVHRQYTVEPPDPNATLES